LTIYEQLVAYCEAQKREGKTVEFASGELKRELLVKYGTPENSTLPPDYCYNMINEGIQFIHHIFEQRGEVYHYLGPDVPYSGIITWKGTPVGKWENGSFYLWERFGKVNRKHYRPELRPTDAELTSLGKSSTQAHATDVPDPASCAPQHLPPQEAVSLPEVVDIREVQRKDATISRIVRDTKQASSIKRLYNHACQVCGLVLHTSVGPYAEAAHIVPLGQPFNGSDTIDNILCLCPNHHVLFDYGAFSIGDSLFLVGLQGKLSVHPQHSINKEYLKHHRDRNLKQIRGT
jgi:5-methylcytosine-specific restriction endonuclease McrA